MLYTGCVGINNMGRVGIIQIARAGINFRSWYLPSKGLGVLVVSSSIEDPIAAVPMPGGTIKWQFPYDVWQHGRHGMQRVRQQLLQPGDAHCGSRSEIGLVNRHNDDKVGTVRQQGPVLETIEVIIVVLVDRKSTRLNSSHPITSYPSFSFQKKTLFL